MNSGGGTISYLRNLAQVKNYLSKHYPSLSGDNVKNNVNSLLKYTSSESSDIEKTNERYVDKNVEERKSDEVISLDQSNWNYSDVFKFFYSINNYLPQLPQLAVRGNPTKDAQDVDTQKPAIPKWMLKKKETVSRLSIDSRTRHLIKSLNLTDDPALTLHRIEDLCQHIKKFPETRGVAVKCSGIGQLLKVLENESESGTAESAREALALIGYTEPVKGQGIRILSIDGGGVRGIVALTMLRYLEKRTGKSIHELFDFVCGVSTGALLAVLLSCRRLSLDDCEKLYRKVSLQVFSQNTFRGTASLVWNSSFYDSNVWNDILRQNVSDVEMIETMKTDGMNKVCLVSSQTSAKLVRSFLFRNYTLPHRSASRFDGCCNALLWEAVRASAAAPGYFSEFKMKDLVLLDGGVIVNNPTAIAIHEARQLWPDTSLQSVVSLGTGRHEPMALQGDTSINWASRIKTIINSATDTEGVHTTLHDLLPGHQYFRFNPYLSEEIYLDENREHKLSGMIADTDLYMRKNEVKLTEATVSLTKSKSSMASTMDYINKKKQVWSV